jgi:hypothetical protein
VLPLTCIDKRWTASRTAQDLCWESWSICVIEEHAGDGIIEKVRVIAQADARIRAGENGFVHHEGTKNTKNGLLPRRNAENAELARSRAGRTSTRRSN